MNPMDNIIYISIPEDFHHHVGEFHIDPSILLPVETSGTEESWQPDELTWEMILAGMLKVIAFEPDHEDAGYYRRFILAARPDIVHEFSETGIISARNGNLQIAEEIFLALAHLEPEAYHPRINLALVYEQRADAFDTIGNAEQAASYMDLAGELYSNLLKSDDTIPEVNLNAGLFYLKSRDYQRARDQLDFFVREGDDDEKIRRAKGLIHEIDSQSLIDTLFRQAFELIKSGKEEDGIEKVKEFLVHHPDAWNGWFLLGWGHRRVGHFSDAYDAFQKVMELGGESVDTLNELAICAMELGSYDESRRTLEAALRLDADDTKVISNLGVLAMKQGNTEDARQFFSTVLEISPDDPLAHEYLKLL